MDRLAILALCGFGCAAVPHGATSPFLDEAKVAAYDAPLSVVLDAVRDVAMTRFHGVAVSPRERTVWTNWQWTYGAPEESFLRPRSSEGYAGGTLWRVDVWVTRERPWRVKVTPHSAYFEEEEAIANGTSGASEDPAWLQQYADAFLAQIHERLRAFAVIMTEPPHSRAVVDTSLPPLPPRELVGPPGQIVIERDTSPRGIDRYRLSGLSQRVALIEGATIDVSSRAPIGGVIITASIRGELNVLQTVSDDTGYYRFDDLKPGMYTINAYYSISHRGQFEVRRSDIQAEAGEISIVPIYMDARE